MNDREVKGFNNPEELRSFLVEREKNTKWISDINVSDVGFEAIPKEVAVSENEEWKDTVLNGTGIWLLYGSLIYPVRACAMQSIFDRTGTRCSFISALPSKRKAEILSEACEYADTSCRWGYNPEKERRKGQLYIVDGKVSAFLSDNRTKIDYRNQDSSEVFNLVKEAIENVSTVEKFDGFYSYEFLDTTWKMDKKVQLDGIDGSINTYNIVFHFSTSDVGKAALSLSTKLTDGISTIPVGNGKIPHRKKMSGVDFNNVIDQLMKQIDNSQNDYDDLKNVVVHFPVQCLKNIVKEYQMPVKIGNEIIANYEKKFGNIPTTAYTLFLVLCQINEILFNRCIEKVDYRNQQELNVLKTLSPSVWIKNDTNL